MKRVIKYLLIVLLIGTIYIFGINFYVISSTKNLVLDKNDEINSDYDAILVLGASVIGDEPSPILEERILQGINLYEDNAAPIIIMSGDARDEYYDEVNVMKDYAINKGVPEENIIIDTAGLSTYESVYRVKYVFNVDKVLIVTQEYHLYRALYIASSLGIEANGISFKEQEFSGGLYRELREVAARNKDFILSIFKPEPNIDL